MGIDPDLVVPNKNLSIYEEAIACWRGEKMSLWNKELMANAAKFNFPIHKPFFELTQEQKNLIWTGNAYFRGLNEFFRMLEDGLCAGLGSACFHDIKRKELLLMMWNMYTRDELFMLLQPAIEQRSSFKDFVYRNYRNILDVKTFAVKANMSVSTFQRWFKLEFGQLPGEWLKERRAEIVLREIITTDKPFSVIAEEFGFSSGSHLGTFCKQHFGQLPSRLRPKNTRV